MWAEPSKNSKPLFLLKLETCILFSMKSKVQRLNSNKTRLIISSGNLNHKRVQSQAEHKPSRGLAEYKNVVQKNEVNGIK